MKKLLLICFVAITAMSGLAWPVAAADGVITPQLSTVDLSAMPLVSRSLAEFDSDGAASDVPAGTPGHAPYTSQSNGPGWLFASLVEPFYLTVLGTALLVLGTIRGRRDV